MFNKALKLQIEYLKKDFNDLHDKMQEIKESGKCERCKCLQDSLILDKLDAVMYGLRNHKNKVDEAHDNLCHLFNDLEKYIRGQI